MSEHSPASGTLIGQYRVESKLGEGGMGEVWLATDVPLDRTVALKLLPAEVTQDPARVSRFEREARAASALNHPNVCTILGLGQTADGRHYIAMEHVDGATLRARLAASLAIPDALDIAIQVAAALSAAHAAGIVHRDIKPENVMIRPDGLVKVLDFGLAKLVTTGDDSTGTSTETFLGTRVGTVLGTAAYMSPEQAEGKAIDRRSDIFAFGSLLYEMTAGEPAFTGESMVATLAAVLHKDPATRNGGHCVYPSADETQIYYTKNDGDSALWTMPVAGGPEHEVLPSVATARSSYSATASTSFRMRIGIGATRSITSTCVPVSSHQSCRLPVPQILACRSHPIAGMFSTQRPMSVTATSCWSRASAKGLVARLSP